MGDGGFGGHVPQALSSQVHVLWLSQTVELAGSLRYSLRFLNLLGGRGMGKGVLPGLIYRNKTPLTEG